LNVVVCHAVNNLLEIIWFQLYQIPALNKGLIDTVHEISINAIGIEACQFLNKKLSWICNIKRIDWMKGLGALDSFTMVAMLPSNVLWYFPKVPLDFFDASLFKVCIDRPSHRLVQERHSIMGVLHPPPGVV